MSDDFDIPFSETAPPVVDRGPTPIYPLSTEQLYQAAQMAAQMLPGLVHEAAPETLSPAGAAALSVETAMHILNEVRRYRLQDGVAVKPEEPHA